MGLRTANKGRCAGFGIKSLLVSSSLSFAPVGRARRIKRQQFIVKDRCDQPSETLFPKSSFLASLSSNFQSVLYLTLCLADSKSTLVLFDGSHFANFIYCRCSMHICNRTFYKNRRRKTQFPIVGFEDLLATIPVMLAEMVLC